MRQNTKCSEIPEGGSGYECWMLALLKLHNSSIVQA